MDKLYDVFADTKDLRLIIEMTKYFEGDAKRIQHFIKVHNFVQIIGRLEMGENINYKNLCTAAIVHDIGIKEAEEKYGKGNCGGDLQQKLGPPAARKMLEQLNYKKSAIERVCFLVEHHHTYENVDGLDWQILLEADFLVNAYEDELPKESIKKFAQKVFVTKTGSTLLNNIYKLDDFGV